MKQHQDPNVKRWLNDPNFIAFQRQSTEDIFVGRRRGVNPKALRKSFKAFLMVVEDNMSAMFEEGCGCYETNVHGGWREEIDDEA